MWIVKLALRRPYTFIVMSVLIVVMGVAAIIRTPKDIFPDIDIPVIGVIWTYQGLSAQEFERRITVYSEYALSANVNDIERIESQTIDGVGIIRLFFHPGVKISDSLAQTTAVSQAILRRMPPGVQPPIILRYTAASVPIVQMSLSSDKLSESELYDYGIFRVRQQIAVINGITLPAPYGGKVRQIVVDLDPEAMQAKGLSARDVNDAINLQNLVLPSGTAKIGDTEFRVALNNSPAVADAINNIPVKMVNGVPIYVRDVAHVHDGFQPQQNIVRTEGKRSTLLTILKNGSASTLDIVDGIKWLLPGIQASAPPGMSINLLFDQSVFVQRAIESVLHEGMIAAVLTGIMILLFLGSWRSTVIVLISIPLSILVSITLLSAMGYSINVMTLGGLALAIGILVDDATVEIENIHRNLAMGKPLERAILDGARQIATPAFVATLAICIVFIPVVLLQGPARFLFVPFALAVVFAVATSYLLSRTVVPVLVKYLLANEKHHVAGASTSIFARIHDGFNNAFERFRGGYLTGLRWSLIHRGAVLAVFGLILASALLALPFVGRDFFPTVDAGQIRLHVMAKTGLRVEETEKVFSAVEAEIRNIIPAQDLNLILDNFGVPSEAYNMAFGDSATLGTSDGEILISLSHDRQKGAPDYVADLREKLAAKFPDVTFYFQPADIVSQILNFGLPTPINIRIAGYNKAANLQIAREIRDRMAKVPGAVDVHLHQQVDAPQLKLDADRTLLTMNGLTQRNLADDLLVSLSSSTQVTPNYWVDPQLGVPYLVAVQTPQHRVDSVDALLRMPVSSHQGTQSQLLGNLASVSRSETNAVGNHFNIQPVYDIYANVQGRDLGGVIGDINKIVDEYQPKMAPGNQIFVRGLVVDMESAFTRLGLGFLAAIAIVYLLMVVNFQSWLDPFIIITALPGAVAGIVWALFLTGTTLNVPSLMGAMMSVGVATANAILMVTFANQRMLAGRSSRQSAYEAGSTRLRPVLMTALAMVLGMLPMAIGFGEGGEQNAPLGRAVIGGLTVATLATLFLVPVVFSFLRKVPNQILAEDMDEEEHEEIKHVEEVLAHLPAADSQTVR